MPPPPPTPAPPSSSQPPPPLPLAASLTRNQPTLIRCYCDICPNNTCIVDSNTGRCFARVEIDTSVGQFDENQSSEVDVGLIAASNGKAKLKKTYNCLPSTPFLPPTSKHLAGSDGGSSSSSSSNPSATSVSLASSIFSSSVTNINDNTQYDGDDGGNLFKQMICGAPANDIMRCCNDRDYCNKNSTFLPPDEEMLVILQNKSKIGTDLIRPSNAPFYRTATEPYSSTNTPLELKLVFVVLSGLLLIITVALAKSRFSKRRSRWRGRTSADNSRSLDGTTSSSHNRSAGPLSTSQAEYHPIEQQPHLSHQVSGLTTASATTTTSSQGHPSSIHTISNPNVALEPAITTTNLSSASYLGSSMATAIASPTMARNTTSAITNTATTTSNNNNKNNDAPPTLPTPQTAGPSTSRQQQHPPQPPKGSPSAASKATKTNTRQDAPHRIHKRKHRDNNRTNDDDHHEGSSNNGDSSTSYSEISSSKANSYVAVFDTNSMASREPLINNSYNISQTNPSNCFSMVKNSPFYALQNNNPYRGGPYMTPDESFATSKHASTFQMTIGSASLGNRPENSSGSGAGQPYLTQRSIAHDIQLHEIVGRGYFGVVWRGEYKGGPVAVKIFSPMAEPSWERESEIYQTTMLRHKNILGFIASDQKHDAGVTGYWLVTDYYPMGSLYDFLKENSTSMADAMRMAFSIANGLAHLHMEIFGTFGKPAIAHRDMKSKNILVKNDGTCCIADLGMAVRYSSTTNMVDVPTNARVGTRRYLAPELLESKLNLMDFESVKATDIYALGLILWELLRRACLADPANRQLDPKVFYLPDSPSSASISMSSVRRSPRSMATTNIDSSPLTSTPTKAGPSPSRLSQVDPNVDQAVSSSPPLTRTPSNTSELSTTTSSSGGHHHHQIPATLPEEDESEGEGELKEEDKENYENRPIHGLEHLESRPLLQHQISTPPGASASANISMTSTDSAAKEPLTEQESFQELATVCDPYEVPYQEYVSIDPSTEEMREIVCEKKIRPPVSYRWTKFAPMRDYQTLMAECWYEKPQARLSALRVRKSLSDIARFYFNLDMEYD